MLQVKHHNCLNLDVGYLLIITISNALSRTFVSSRVKSEHLYTVIYALLLCLDMSKDHGTKTGLDTVSTTKDDVTYQRFSEFVGNDHFRPG